MNPHVHTCGAVWKDPETGFTLRCGLALGHEDQQHEARVTWEDAPKRRPRRHLTRHPTAV